MGLCAAQQQSRLVAAACPVREGASQLTQDLLRRITSPRSKVEPGRTTALWRGNAKEVQGRIRQVEDNVGMWCTRVVDQEPRRKGPVRPRCACPRRLASQQRQSPWSSGWGGRSRSARPSRPTSRARHDHAGVTSAQLTTFSKALVVDVAVACMGPSFGELIGRRTGTLAERKQFRAVLAAVRALAAWFCDGVLHTQRWWCCVEQACSLGSSPASTLTELLSHLRRTRWLSDMIHRPISAEASRAAVGPSLHSRSA